MSDEFEKIPLCKLSRKQRRVLGTLLEKAFTTPDQYPLTLKSVVTGCNQKSNRDPVTAYDEDACQQTLDELRELGFVGELHTEGGRTSRFRHYMRQRTTLSEPQLAIMTELMLRGRQQLGELRTRASRMVNIESQETLRAELTTLLELGLVRTNGSLERRGVEVDHDLYPPGENHEDMGALAEESEPSPRPVSATLSATPHASSADQGRISELESQLAGLQTEISELREQFGALQDLVDDLRKQLGA